MNIDILNNNKIIVLDEPGKTPLRVRPSGSVNLWDSLGLIIAAVGACSGGTIVDYCRFNDLNSDIFEDITIEYDSNNKFIIQAVVPHDLDDLHISILSNQLRTCPASKYIKSEIEVNLVKSEKAIKEIKPKKRGCCGGS